MSLKVIVIEEKQSQLMVGKSLSTGYTAISVYCLRYNIVKGSKNFSVIASAPFRFERVNFYDCATAFVSCDVQFTFGFSRPYAITMADLSDR